MQILIIILPIKKLFALKQGHKESMFGNAPQAIQSKFQPISHKTDQLQGPVTRCDVFKSSLLYSGCVLWNTLPPTIRSTNGSVMFKEQLFNHLENTN